MLTGQPDHMRLQRTERSHEWTLRCDREVDLHSFFAQPVLSNCYSVPDKEKSVRTVLSLK